jgi:hypothetical protein
MPRNPRPAWRGIGGRHAAESGAGIGRNTQTPEAGVYCRQWLYPMGAESVLRGGSLKGIRFASVMSNRTECVRPMFSINGGTPDGCERGKHQ